METTIRVKDDMRLNDKTYSGHIPMPTMPLDCMSDKEHKNYLWAKTEVLVGHGPVLNNPNGKSTLGEDFISYSNTVPLGGVQYAFQKLFECAAEQIPVPTLYSQAGIGLPNSVVPTDTYLTPDGYKVVQYRYGHFVQLMGVGITGTSENDVTKYIPDYRECSMDIAKVSTDGLTITGTMLPFRYTPDVLTTTERAKYFGKKTFENGYTGYYLKKFESDVLIKHIWKTGEDVDDETLIPSSDVWQNSNNKNAVESFTEIILKVSKKDIKEWFVSLEQEDRTRINTIALFNGRFVRDLNDAADYGDYEDVMLFSKLGIKPEYLDIAKDLNVVYRVYGA